MVEGLPENGRALVVGHSRTNEAAVLGFTGRVVRPLGKGEGGFADRERRGLPGGAAGLSGRERFRPLRDEQVAHRAVRHEPLAPALTIRLDRGPQRPSHGWHFCVASRWRCMSRIRRADRERA